jgi:hypothetical protein
MKDTSGAGRRVCFGPRSVAADRGLFAFKPIVIPCRIPCQRVFVTSRDRRKSLRGNVHPGGFEPPTPGSEGQNSAETCHFGTCRNRLNLCELQRQHSRTGLLQQHIVYAMFVTIPAIPCRIPCHQSQPESERRKAGGDRLGSPDRNARFLCLPLVPG